MVNRWLEPLSRSGPDRVGLVKIGIISSNDLGLPNPDCFSALITPRYLLFADPTVPSKTKTTPPGTFGCQSVLVIDKNVGNLSRIADRHYIIERGRTMWSGTSEQLIAEPELQHRYLGI